MKLRTSLIAVSILILFFLSCSPEVGLFYSIELEEELVEGSLPEDITIGAIADNSSGTLLLAAGGLYLNTGSTWDIIESRPDGMSDSLALSSAFLNNTFFVCFTKIDGTSSGLFSTVDPSSSEIQWESVTDAVDASYIFLQDNMLFVVTGTYNDYTLSYSTDGSSFSTILTDLISATTIDIAYDGTDYWLVWGHDLYSGSLGSLSEVDSSGFDDFLSFGGIYFDNNTNSLFLSVNDDEYGYIWNYKDSEWTLIADSLDYFVHDYCNYTTTSNEDLILVGSDDGYYEYESDSFENPSLSCNNAVYVGLDISNAVILDFYNTDSGLYAFTLNNGLWVNIDEKWSLE